jgi:hypothetical protein
MLANTETTLSADGREQTAFAVVTSPVGARASAKRLEGSVFLPGKPRILTRDEA